MDLFFITLVDKKSTNKTLNLQKMLVPYTLSVLDTYDYELKNLSKIFKTYEYIVSCKNILENDILCIVDGHDILFNNKFSKLDLIKDFTNANVDMIISGESNFAHHCDTVKDFFEINYKNKYRYLNSGVIICYKWAYVKFFKDIIDNFDKYKLCGNTSDQRIIGLYIKDKTQSNTLPIKVTIDDSGYFTNTITTHWNGDLDKINSYFVHVTFLAHRKQNERYQYLLQKFLH